MRDQDKINSYNDDIKRLHEANSIINNPLYAESFKIVEDSLIKELTSTNFKEVEVREELYRRIQLLNNVKSVLNKVIQKGKIAEEKLSFLDRAKKLAGL